MEKKTLQIGVGENFITFNDGNTGRLFTIKKLGLNDLRKYTVKGLNKLDMDRLQKANIIITL